MYNCKKCPGYCCSYPLIPLDKRDVERLAKHFGLTFRQAKAKFTVERWGRKYSMRRKADVHFGRVCRFFDTDKRCCTVYEARPSLCRWRIWVTAAMWMAWLSCRLPRRDSR